jgi:hypothetical protein
MYRELQPFREALSQELKASLFPTVAGVEPNKLLQTYLDRLTMYIGVDVADQTFTALALDAGKEILGSLEGCANDPDGFQPFVTWARALRDHYGWRIIAIAGETTASTPRSEIGSPGSSRPVPAYGFLLTTTLFRQDRWHSPFSGICGIIEAQTGALGCHLDSQDGFVGLPDGDHRSTTPLEVPIVLLLDLPVIHDLVANALHTANPQGFSSGAESVPAVKVASKRLPASSIC